jgi:ankyrin repeat protein
MLKENKLEIINHLLVLSCISGSVSSVKQLLKNGAYVQALCEWSLECAIKNNKYQIIKILLENGAGGNLRPLRIAAEKGNLKLVKLLYNYCEDDYYALEIACESGYLNIVKFFVNHGCQINHRALDNAVNGEHFEIVKFLVKSGAKIDLDLIKQLKNKKIIDFITKMRKKS